MKSLSPHYLSAVASHFPVKAHFVYREWGSLYIGEGWAQWPLVVSHCLTHCLPQHSIIFTLIKDIIYSSTNSFSIPVIITLVNKDMLQNPPACEDIYSPIAGQHYHHWWSRRLSKYDPDTTARWCLGHINYLWSVQQDNQLLSQLLSMCEITTLTCALLLPTRAGNGLICPSPLS